MSQKHIMLNAEELFNRYKNLDSNQYVGYGGCGYYEINSDVEVSLNRTYRNYILNEAGEAQTYTLLDDEDVFAESNREYYKDEYFDEKSDVPTEYYLTKECSTKSWGKTLDKYFIHPFYPDKKITRIMAIKTIPFAIKDDVFPVENNMIHINESIFYTLEQVLQYPEFFKPLYDE